MKSVCIFLILSLVNWVSVVVHGFPPGIPPEKSNIESSVFGQELPPGIPPEKPDMKSRVLGEGLPPGIPPEKPDTVSSVDDRSQKCQIFHPLPGCKENSNVECINFCDILTQNFFKKDEKEPYKCCMDFCTCECRFESRKEDGSIAEAAIRDLVPE